jgi:CBS-domain-containing membrane protein
MRALDIGFLPVIDELWTRKLMGVVTDRDLCLAALAEEHNPTLTTVEDCMATDLVTCTPDMDIREVLETMARHQIRRLPVVDRDGHVQGIVGISDVIRHNAADPRDIWMALSRITAPKEVRAKAA